MTRHWVIAPYRASDVAKFDSVWAYDLAHGCISIGFNGLGDVSSMTKQEIADVATVVLADKPLSTQALVTNMLWAFYHDIVPGDIVLARRGLKVLAGVGRVTSPAVYDPGRNPESGQLHFLNVDWFDSPRDTQYPTLVFPMPTVSEITAEKFNNLLRGTPSGPEVPEEAEGVENKTEFVLEKYLEHFIVTNFKYIFGGSLQLYETPEGGECQQYPTDVGPIDILAVEPSTNSFVVIELKKGRPSDKVVGQILRYMGWVKKHLCCDGQTVKGLIICRDPDEKLSYALEMTNGIDVRFYKLSFELSATP